MKVVVGLGNPGKKYEGTRHNVGFEVLAQVARRHAASNPKKRFDAEIAEALLANERLLLVAPQTYMNVSGRSVRQVIDFFQLNPADVLIVCDDMNLPLGRLRLRRAGTAGGQKGLADIIRHIGTEDVPRLRIGIARPPTSRTSTDYVLDRFSKSERPAIEGAIALAADAIEVWCAQGIAAAMTRFNANPTDSATDSPE